MEWINSNIIVKTLAEVTMCPWVRCGTDCRKTAAINLQVSGFPWIRFGTADLETTSDLPEEAKEIKREFCEGYKDNSKTVWWDHRTQETTFPPKALWELETGPQSKYYCVWNNTAWNNTAYHITLSFSFWENVGVWIILAISLFREFYFSVVLRSYR